MRVLLPTTVFVLLLMLCLIVGVLAVQRDSRNATQLQGFLVLLLIAIVVLVLFAQTINDGH